MPIKTSTSMSGFVCSTPRLTRSEDGEPRLFMKVGQQHFQREPDGSFTQQESTYHDLVIFRKTAERAAAQFQKGDRFVAEGYVHVSTVTNEDGETREQEEFVARRIGHDVAVTDYTMNRRGRANTLDATAVQQGPTNQASEPLRAPEPVQTIGM
ncbi:MAG: single-stranded DNA-binding protein [Propionibacteriaceae bacterium]|nr:single-stranded DNA-binding protein [Propionibacteriaceae bacterium]